MNNIMHFEDSYELVDEIFNSYEDNDNNIVVIADYEIAKDVIAEIIRYDEDVTIGSIEILSPEMEGYDGPWLVCYIDGEIWCEKAISNGKMLYFDSNIVFVQNKYYESAKKSYLSDGKVIAFDFTVHDEDNVDFHYIYDDDGKVHGFSYANGDNGHCFHMVYSTTETMNPDCLLDVSDRLKRFFD